MKVFQSICWSAVEKLSMKPMTNGIVLHSCVLIVSQHNVQIGNASEHAL